MLRYFISDLHLQAQRPEITAALLHFLENIAPGADELYLLGDIFEAWVGDDSTDPVIDQISPAFTSLQQQGTAIFFIHGNRDFLLGPTGANKLSAELLPEQHVIELPQGRTVLLHGDELCTDDTEYQAFRQMVRAEEWQTAFLAKPLEERLAIARQLRETSKAAGTTKTEEIMDVSDKAVSAMFTKQGATLMIHGHTHRPARHQHSKGEGEGEGERERIVLGDWSDKGWYVVADDNAITLVEFSPS